MLPLAQWVMRGRGQAIGLIFVLLAISLLAWPSSVLAASAIALVGLRTGSKNGFELSLWALLPAAALLKFGSFMPLIMVASVPILSAILRQTRSWIYVLLAVSLLGLLLAIALQTLGQSLLTSYVLSVQQAFEKMASQTQQPELYQQLKALVTTQFLAGIAGLVATSASFIALLIARYWQAGLYNPGGFAQEFRQLRWPKAYLPAVAIAVAVLLGLDKALISWVWIVLFPLLITGIALFHAVAWHKQLKKHWYIIFYAVVLMGDLAKMIVIAFAVADSLVDWRKKFTRPHTD